MLKVKTLVLMVFFVRTIFEISDLRAARKITKCARGKHTLNNALVIANGPSTSRIDSDKIRIFQNNGNNVFAVNWFALSDIGRTIIPQYYVLSDPQTSPISTNERCKSLWTILEGWEQTVLVVPHNWRRIMPKVFDDRVLFIDDRELIGWTNKTDPVSPRGYLSMTAYKALAMCLYMHHAETYLIGFDNSMFVRLAVTESNQIISESLHFYSQENTEINDLSYWYPNGMSDALYDHARCFADLRRCFRNQNIFNLDEHSFTDTFKKVPGTSFLKS